MENKLPSNEWLPSGCWLRLQEQTQVLVLLVVDFVREANNQIAFKDTFRKTNNLVPLQESPAKAGWRSKASSSSRPRMRFVRGRCPHSANFPSTQSEWPEEKRIKDTSGSSVGSAFLLEGNSGSCLGERILLVVMEQFWPRPHELCLQHENSQNQHAFLGERKRMRFLVHCWTFIRGFFSNFLLCMHGVRKTALRKNDQTSSILKSRNTQSVPGKICGLSTPSFEALSKS